MQAKDKAQEIYSEHLKIACSSDRESMRAKRKAKQAAMNTVRYILMSASGKIKGTTYWAVVYQEIEKL